MFSKVILMVSLFFSVVTFAQSEMRYPNFKQIKILPGNTCSDYFGLVGYANNARWGRSANGFCVRENSIFFHETQQDTATSSFYLYEARNLRNNENLAKESSKLDWALVDSAKFDKKSRPSESKLQKARLLETWSSLLFKADEERLGLTITYDPVSKSIFDIRLDQ